MKNDFNMCPMCGSKAVINHNNRKWTCPDCGFDLYCNVAAAVGIIIKDKYNNVLFEVRAKEPRKGFVALPGGFVESAEGAVVRECREEIGVEVTNGTFLCTFPNTYAYKNIEYKTCDMFFTAELSSEFDSIEDFIKNLKADNDNVDMNIFKSIHNVNLATVIGYRESDGGELHTFTETYDTKSE